MDKNLTFELEEKYQKILHEFCQSYRQIEGAKESTLDLFLHLVRKEVESPFTFHPYHKKVRSPIDYYRFGLDFIEPMIDLSTSQMIGLDLLEQIDSQLKRGDNVVLLANHQTEADPQVMGLLIEQTHPHIAENLIYIAGERVITDPIAIPFSMGCDLLCIYSKRYINHPPEFKEEKQLHNKNTMGLMSRLLQEGGKIIYVAPSGGRDRKNTEGVIEVAKFDPSSIELFQLMAKKAKTPTHFYPFALSTYALLPPPDTIQKELGEIRIAKKNPAHLAFLPEFNMDIFPGFDDNDKIARRQRRAEAIWKIVKETHDKMA